MMAQEAQWKIQEFMLQTVADALGPELLARVAFVGGCTTALLVTDDGIREEARATEDVDVVVHVLGIAGWYALQEILRSRGFRQAQGEDVVCRMRLPRAGQTELIVDFMPDDEKILGFSNRWYAQALNSAKDFRLAAGATIRVVRPPFFLATKLEAWQGRGRNDLLASRDVDDILMLIRGRPELRDELLQAENELREFIAQGLRGLQQHNGFAYAVMSAVNGDPGDERHFFRRFKTLCELG